MGHGKVIYHGQRPPGVQAVINKIAGTPGFEVSIQKAQQLRHIAAKMIMESIHRLYGTLLADFYGHTVSGNLGDLRIDITDGQVKLVNGAAVEVILHHGGYSYTTATQSGIETFHAIKQNSLRREFVPAAVTVDVSTSTVST